MSRLFLILDSFSALAAAPKLRVPRQLTEPLAELTERTWIKLVPGLKTGLEQVIPQLLRQLLKTEDARRASSF